MNEAILRGARSEDYEDACRLFDLVDALHRARAPWLFQAPAAQPRSWDFFEGLLAATDAAVFVAEVGPLVGIAQAAMRTAPDLPIFVPQRWAVLDDLVVTPAWRRRGIGRALVQAVERWADEQGAAWVELNVYAFNDEAAEFYRSLGYLPLSSKMRKPRTGSA